MFITVFAVELIIKLDKIQFQWLCIFLTQLLLFFDNQNLLFNLKYY